MNPESRDRELTETISTILRVGVTLSASIIAMGLVLILAAPPQGAPPTLQAMLASDFGGRTLTLSGWLAGFLNGNAVSVLQLGMLVLLATPMVRVGTSVLLFYREKDMRYVGITLLVLGMLLFALLIVGPREG